MTQYMLSVHYSDKEVALTPEEQQQSFKQTEILNGEMQKAGIWVFAGGLEAPDIATVVRTAGGDTVTTDGPYPETKEQLGGFWIIDVPDLDVALEWAGKSSTACMSPVEVRPFQGE